MTSPLDPPFARGRSADVHAIGDDLVLRRNRDHDVRPAEVAAMELAESAGFPVPHVHRVERQVMVMDRVDGRDMLSLLGDRPWRVRRYARELADLHVRLREVAPDDRLDGDRLREALVHGDLHPGNVLMSSAGPIVIDWENACAGPADFDVATTWLLTEVGEPDEVPVVIRPILALIRATFRRAFLRCTGRPRRPTVDLVCDRRLRDPNMSPAERDRIRAFKARHGSGASV